MSLAVDTALLGLAGVGLFGAFKYEYRTPNWLTGLFTIPALSVGVGIGWWMQTLFASKRAAFLGLMAVCVMFIWLVLQRS